MKAKRAECGDWRKLRANWLQRIFKGVEAKSQRGIAVRRSLRAAARRWQGRKYPTGKRVHFSEQRLRSLFYAWKAKGGEALVVRCSPMQSRVSKQLLAGFLNECLRGGVFSMAEAFRRLLLEKPLSVHCFYRATSKAHRRALQDYHKTARRADRIRSALMQTF